jgi:CubicO group peptidase (beta-lactamase class C family)
MKKIFLMLLIVCLFVSCKKQVTNEPPPQSSTLYFPPSNSDTWESITPQSLGWDMNEINSLYSFLEQKNTRAFLVLKDGRIVIEKYFGNDAQNRTFTSKSFWYWASAGKTLTAFLVGKAQEDGFLKISDRTSQYLGRGWTRLTTQQEDAITIRHQLTMTSGLNDNVADKDCTRPECLQYLAPAGSRWAYHNAPYTLLEKAVSTATKQSYNNYFSKVLGDKIGMAGSWLSIDFNNVYFSTPRSMARFGILILNKGKWDKEIVMKDQDFFTQMVNTSQNLNLSYGYLWWLNGKSSIMVPGLQTVFPRSLAPNVPTDMFAAMGKNGQLLNIVPSKNLIMIRMGETPDIGDVPFTIQEEIWERLNKIMK